MAAAWVLKTFQIDESGLTGAHVFVEARQPGLFAFILNLLGLDPTATLKVTKGSISFRMAKLSGMTQTSTSLNQIGSFQGGYKKPIELLFLSFFFFIWGVIFSFTTNEMFFITFFSWGASGLLIICYALFKHLFIGFETSGGAYYGMTFKGGILNNVSVDIDQIEYTIAFINSLIGSASLGGVFSESRSVTKVANQAVIKSNLAPIPLSPPLVPIPPLHYQQHIESVAPQQNPQYPHQYDQGSQL
jgi:hypothetical protein